MTERLFDFDSMLAEFSATVLSSEKCENGYKTLLDKTAFFSEGGGQKSDTGFLDSEEIFDVQEENEKIYHYSKNEISLGTVKGKIDFEKRFDKMQNHSGEHWWFTDYPNGYLTGEHNSYSVGLGIYYGAEYQRGEFIETYI